MVAGLDPSSYCLGVWFMVFYLIIGSGQSGVKNDDGKSEERKGRNESDFEHEVAEAAEKENFT